MSEAATAIKSDPWQWWRGALAEPDIRKRQGMWINEPAQGYYRLWWQGKWHAVAYWCEADGLHCLVSDNWFHKDEATHLRIAVEQWTRAGKAPISEDTYNAVLAGEPWPDLDPNVERWIEEAVARVRAEKMSNQPPEDETPEQRFKRLSTELKDQIANAINEAKQYENIGSDDMSARALTAVRWLQKLARDGETNKKAEIGDHYAIYKNALDRWNPIVSMARGATAAIEGAMSRWENKKAADERKRQAEIEKKRQEQLAREQAEADRQIAQGTPPSQMTPPAEQQVFDPEPTPAPRSQIRGAYGPAASVVMVPIGKIVDQDAVYQHFKGKTDVIAALQKEVDRAVKAGNTVPGVEVTQERKVRG